MRNRTKRQAIAENCTPEEVEAAVREKLTKIRSVVTKYQEDIATKKEAKSKTSTENTAK